jgi:chromosome segregation ATPase
VGADRPGLAGQLTQRIVIPSDQEQAGGARPVPNPERARLQNEIATYEQQLHQGQTTLASVEGKIQQLQSQMPKLEEDAKTAGERLAELTRPVKTNVTERSPATEQPKTGTSQPPAEPDLPWYKRLWKKFSG